MKWYRKLYLGEEARRCKLKLLGHVIKSRFTIDTYLIVLASNEDNLLDICSANILMQPHFKKKPYKDNIYVVGIAKGRDEALELVRQIIDDVYSATGGFDIRGYLHFGDRRA